jgi:hypothetical protein
MAGCGRAAALTTGRFRQNLANVQEGWGKSLALFVSVADGVELVRMEGRWGTREPLNKSILRSNYSCISFESWESDKGPGLKAPAPSGIFDLQL